MAKIRHNNIIDTVDEVFSLAKEKRSLHLYADDYRLDGRSLTINGNETLHFGTCGYLGLEQHPQIKKGAIEAIDRYGVQFPMSKTYVSNPLYTELEEQVESMYGAPVVISKNCTLSHLATIPVLIRQTDVIILDHQVHASVQEASKKLLGQGVAIEMIRHSNLDMLEERVKELRNKYERIWYMADGVYSMYGDFAPIKDMIALAEKYDQLYLYVDDAHGMSWTGKHGTGYVMSQMEGLYRKMILTATLGKGFGACGGLTLFPDREWQRKVKTFGGPLTFSVQMEPPILGAAVASAKIHLSDEIYQYQQDLQDKIAYCNTLIKKTDLPLIANNISPIFYIGMGTMAMGNLLINRLVEDGIYVNLAPFPVVPAKNVGARVTISRHNRLEDIEMMVEKFEKHFDEALDEANQTRTKIWKSFKIEPPKQKIEIVPTKNSKPNLSFHKFETIKSIDQRIWDDNLGHRAMFDWAGLQFLEKSFSGNTEKESNWDFKYYVVKNGEGSIVLMTFFTEALYKEDMFLRTSISKAMEEIREKDPFYLTSKALIMGSLFTEGDHLYINKQDPSWKSALLLLMDELYKQQEQNNVSNIILRDFNADDVIMHEFMMEQGFVKVDMPESCVFENIKWNSQEEFLKQLSKKSRRHFVQKIKRFEQYYEVQVKSELSEDELRMSIDLFKNVKNNNLAINSFHFPDKLFHQMNKNPIWEFLMLYVREEPESEAVLVSVVFCHKKPRGIYSPMLIGMNYDYLYKYGVYRQSLYQIIKRANDLNYDRMNFGISAAIEKKRIGMTLYPKIAYFQAKDNYAAEMLANTISLDKD